MFNKKYPFYTGSSELMKLHFKKYADWIKSEFLKSNSKLIEIGSNDGTFLSNFKNYEIEPIKTQGDSLDNYILAIKTFNGII